jgi:hypothetical protein
MIEHLVYNRYANLWADMGMGKTSGALMALMGLSLGDDPFPAFVFAPKRVAEDVWPDEVNKWTQLSGIRVQPVLGTMKERTEKLRLPAEIYVINYDNVPWLVEHVGVAKWKARTIIADEARRLKNMRIQQGGKRTKALSELVLAGKIDRWWNLTGRPAPNGLTDLWGQQWFLDRGFRLGRSYNAFLARWFSIERMADAVNPSKFYARRVAHPYSQAEIQTLLSDVSLTVDPKDWFDVKEPVERNVEVRMPKKAHLHYKEMEKAFFTEIEGHEVEAFAAASKSIKCLQLANGAVYTDDKCTQWVETHAAKIEALKSIVEEAPSPVLCAYHFKHDLTRLKQAFPDGADLATRAGMECFKRGEAEIGFGHPASMGHGVDGLQEHCHTVAFFGHWWDMDQRDQLIGRVGPVRQMQAGKDRNVFVYNIVAKGTLDLTVLERHRSKRSVQEVLLEAMKQRNRS